MEAVLLSLPVEVVRDQVLPFLSLKDLVDLDTAACHQKSRRGFHQRLQGVTFDGNLTHKLEGSVLKWLKDRKCSLESIFLSQKTCDEMFVDHAAAFVNTKYCIFNDCKISNQGFEAFVNNCHNLEYLRMECCGQLYSGCIVYLSSRCVNLYALDIAFSHWVRDVDIVALATNCPHLQDLNMRGCDEVTNDSLIALGRHCSGLRLLCFTDSERSITNVGVAALAQGCPLLETLLIERCDFVDEKSLLPLVMNCQQLHSLSFYACRGISDEGFETMLPHMKAIKNLTLLQKNYFITEHMFSALAIHCTNLESLTVRDCRYMTDAALQVSALV